MQKFRTNSVTGGRLREDVTGTGPNALTNSYVWTTNGWLDQVVRSDGSWEVFQYDSQYRPTNVFSSYRSQAGKILRIILPADAIIVWSMDDWNNSGTTHESELSLWFGDFPTAEWPRPCARANHAT